MSNKILYLSIFKDVMWLRSLLLLTEQQQTCVIKAAIPWENSQPVALCPTLCVPR